MSDAGKAVFLSYASQDAGAARRICDALRAAGVEVWFDQSELVGGDSWDQKIRNQIHDCALFIPILSKATQARREAYFRLEWKLADERTHLMAKGTPFLLPVSIDETNDRDALVPDSFLAVQWTKLPGGETPPAFVERAKKLLVGNAVAGVARGELVESADPGPGSPNPAAISRGATAPAVAPVAPRWLRPVLASAVVVIAVLAFTLVSRRDRESGSTKAAPAVAEIPAAPLSEARQLAGRARAIYEAPLAITRDRLDAAEDLCRRALALDSSDAQVWVVAAHVDALLVYFGIDPSEERRQEAQQRAARAMVLAPGDFEVRHAQAHVFGWATGSQPMREEAVKLYRALLREQPARRDLNMELGTVLRDLGQFDEAAALFEKIGDLGSAGWNYILGMRPADARRVAETWLQKQRTVGALLLKLAVEFYCEEDLVAAHQTVSQFTPAELLEDGPAMAVMYVALIRHEPAVAIRVLTAFPREYLSSPGSRGPKRYYLGLAQEMDGKLEAARDEWSNALRVVQGLQKTTPNDIELLGWEAVLHACLGERAEAERLLLLYKGKSISPDDFRILWSSVGVQLRLGQVEQAREEIQVWARRNDLRQIAQAHSTFRFACELDPLRGDPWFEKYLRATLPPGAKPFDDQKPETKP